MEKNERIEIISGYGDVLENRLFSVGRESDLPFPKESIRKALSEELVNPTSPEMLNALEVGFIELETFLSDREYELVSKYEEKLGAFEKLMQDGDSVAAKREAALIAEISEHVATIQKRISQKQKESLEQLQNIRKLRS